MNKSTDFIDYKLVQDQFFDFVLLKRFLEPFLELRLADKKE